MRSLFFFSILCLFFSCSSATKIMLDGQEYEAYNPPNTVQISVNFFADETEVANIDYKEYLYWISYVFGKESNKYQEALPDTLVWREYVTYSEPYIETYHQHPSYSYYPLVGVSLQQAKNYTDWRTERVAEMILVGKGCVKPNPTKDTNSCFTINRYLEGDFDWIIKKEPVLIPEYKIPTIEEWEKIAGVDSGFRYGLDSLSRENKKYLKRGYPLFSTDDYPTSENVKKHSSTHKTPLSTRANSKNIYGLYNIIGNVAELVDQENIVKGGSYRHKIKDIELTKNKKIEKPNAWVGFRNVCRFYLVTPKVN